VSEGGRELITTDEATVFAKPSLDAIVMEHSQGNRGLANPTGPMRVTGVSSSARLITFSIRSSRPKNALGGGGGDSPDALDMGERPDTWAVEAADLA